MSTHYDALVIGSGQGGNPLAVELARSGRRTALIEREHVGGTCINEGCTPTKTMVASARVAHLARRAADYGVDTGAVHVDLQRVRQRKRAIVESWRAGGENRLERNGVELIMGQASFSGPRSLTIALNDGGSREVTADLIIINTGGRPARPDLPGIADLPTLNSTSIMELAELPEHLLVIGGGYIGLEFGQMFRRFGSRVTIIQRARQLLGREDDDVAEAVAQIMREDGIEILLEAQARQAARNDDGSLSLLVDTPAGSRELRGSHLLFAAGRTPNTDQLNLPAAGVETDKQGNIRVNERLETNVPGIYAIGDVKGGPAFTHISYDDYRILKANLIDGKQQTSSGRLVPYTVYIDPQLGRVGLSEQEARAQGRNFRVARMPMSHVARAAETDETRGLIKAIIDADTAQILGFTMLGIEGGELMSAVQLAMLGKLPYTTLRDAIFAHPTIAEALNNLFADL